MGGKLYKNSFTRSVYFARTGLQFPSSDTSVDDKRAFKKFKARHQQFIRNRNCLLDIYEKVIVYFCDLDILSFINLLMSHSLERMCYWTLLGMWTNFIVVLKHFTLCLELCLRQIWLSGVTLTPSCLKLF